MKILLKTISYIVMNIQAVFFIFISILITGCTASRHMPVDCRKLRSGNFILNIYNNSRIGHWRHFTILINRNDTLEYSVSSIFPSDTSYYKIIWTAACEYRSLLLNPKNGLDSFMISNEPKGELNTIIDIQDQYYIIQRTRKSKDTLWITK